VSQYKKGMGEDGISLRSFIQHRGNGGHGGHREFLATDGKDGRRWNFASLTYLKHRENGEHDFYMHRLDGADVCWLVEDRTKHAGLKFFLRIEVE
jgi:hypothetical protein